MAGPANVRGGISGRLRGPRGGGPKSTPRAGSCQSQRRNLRSNWNGEAGAPMMAADLKKGCEPFRRVGRNTPERSGPSRFFNFRGQGPRPLGSSRSRAPARWSRGRFVFSNRTSREGWHDRRMVPRSPSSMIIEGRPIAFDLGLGGRPHSFRVLIHSPFFEVSTRVEATS